MIARLAAIRLLPIRPRYSRYDNQPTTNAAAMATMPLPTVRVSIAVRIENVRSIRAIAQTMTRTTEAGLDAAPDAECGQVCGGCWRFSLCATRMPESTIAHVTVRIRHIITVRHATPPVRTAVGSA